VCRTETTCLLLWTQKKEKIIFMNVMVLAILWNWFIYTAVWYIILYQFQLFYVYKALVTQCELNNRVGQVNYCCVATTKIVLFLLACSLSPPRHKQAAHIQLYTVSLSARTSVTRWDKMSYSLASTQMISVPQSVQQLVLCNQVLRHKKHLLIKNKLNSLEWKVNI